MELLPCVLGALVAGTPEHLGFALLALSHLSDEVQQSISRTSEGDDIRLGLIRAFSAPHAFLRAEAARAWARFGNTGAPLLALLEDEGAVVRLAALRSLLQAFKETAGLEAAVRRLMMDPLAMIRQKCFSEIVRRGWGLSKDELALCLSHPDRYLRFDALRALAGQQQPLTIPVKTLLFEHLLEFELEELTTAALLLRSQPS